MYKSDKRLPGYEFVDFDDYKHTLVPSGERSCAVISSEVTPKKKPTKKTKTTKKIMEKWNWHCKWKVTNFASIIWY